MLSPNWIEVAEGPTLLGTVQWSSDCMNLLENGDRPFFAVFSHAEVGSCQTRNVIVGFVGHDRGNKNKLGGGTEGRKSCIRLRNTGVDQHETYRDTYNKRSGN